MRVRYWGFERPAGRWSDEEKLGIVMSVDTDGATVRRWRKRHESRRHRSMRGGMI